MIETKTTTESNLLQQTLTLKDKKWHYIGEGNANIILAIPADGTVMRIMKNVDGNGKTTRAQMYAMLSKRLDFCNAIQLVFFADSGCNFVDVPVVKSVLPEELHEIDGCIQRCRPANRRHKGLDWTGGLIALCPDYTLLPGVISAIGPVFCAEIKPKQGWLHMADRTVECTFCAHQYLKLYRADVEHISGYCPLDLFSGDRERVERAVVRLFQTPQNNLKMFKDGVQMSDHEMVTDLLQTMFGSGNGWRNRFARFIAAALLGDFDDSKKQRETPIDPEQWHDDGDGEILENVEKLPCDFHAVPMPQHCVLHKILTMQKMQTTSFSDVYSTYEKLPESADQFGHVDKLLQTLSTSILSPVDGYLVAATASDCSVFVTFCQTSDDCTVERCVVCFGGLHYAVRVKVSDLDPKPLSTVDKHRKRDAEILLARDQYWQGRQHKCIMQKSGV